MAPRRPRSRTRSSFNKVEPMVEKVEQILLGTAVAVLVASGFEETHMTEPQRGLLKAGAAIKVISPEPGLVHSWHHDGWGHFFPVDHPLETALGADFDMLVLPGGERSVAKLQDHPHARRIIGHFFDANKPLAVIAEAVSLLMIEHKLHGRRLAASPELSPSLLARLETSGVQWLEEPVVLDSMLISAGSTAQLIQWSQRVLAVFSEVTTRARCDS